MTNYDPNHPYNNPNNPGGGPGQYPVQPGGYVPGMSPYSMEKNSLGGWALGLGIAGLVCCGVFTGIPAIILGYNGMQAADQGRATNKGMATAGLVLGVISIVWTIVALSTGLLDKILNS